MLANGLRHAVGRPAATLPIPSGAERQRFAIYGHLRRPVPIALDAVDRSQHQGSKTANEGALMQASGPRKFRLGL